MNESCQRFEREGLEKLEAGQLLDPHFRECGDCVAAAKEYERVTAALETAVRHLPPANFEAKVWAGIASKHRQRRARFFAPALAACAALVLTVVAWPRTEASPALTITVRNGQAAAVRGAEGPKPGDVLVIEAARGAATYAELRVYRDDALVLRCDGAPTCSTSAGTLAASVPLSAIGRYEAVLVYGDRPLSAALKQGTLNADVDRALEGGARVVTALPVDVH